MKVQVLMLVLLVPWFVHAEPQYYGTRVANLVLSGAESQKDLEVLPLHSGDLITPENVRSSIQALYNTGHYRDIEVNATPAAGGGTDLTFQVRPNFFFSTLRMEPENLLERPLSAYLHLPYGDKFSTSAIDKLGQQTRDL